MDFHLSFDESGFGIFLFALLPGNRLCSLSFSRSGSSLNQALHKTCIVHGVMFSSFLIFFNFSNFFIEKTLERVKLGSFPAHFQAKWILFYISMSCAKSIRTHLACLGSELIFSVSSHPHAPILLCSFSESTHSSWSAFIIASCAQVAQCLARL